MCIICVQLIAQQGANMFPFLLDEYEYYSKKNLDVFQVQACFYNL